MNILNNSSFKTPNNKLLKRCLILFITVAFLACRGTVKEKSNDAQTYSPVSHAYNGTGRYIVTNTKESSVKWKGSMLIGTNSHTGYVYLSKGELMMENGALVGGSLEIDMSTIEDDQHRADNNLIEHLKNPDFFDVTKFPVSAFNITRVAPISGEEKNVTGNLTIKGITQPVSFPAKVQVLDSIVRADGRLVIDRTKWGVRYQSRKFYDLLADKAMSDSIEFHFKIVAKK